jgi:hypothetical protein
MMTDPDLWEYRTLIALATVPILLLFFYLILRLQRWKFSEEIHLSGYDVTLVKAKYFIVGSVLGSIGTYIFAVTG